MNETPDLSSIVNLIMQNPSLIEQISSLAKQGAKDVAEPIEEQKNESAEESITQNTPTPMTKSHRRELLNAMKPYLSENRRVAIDSMSSIMDVIDVMVRK
jgi:hypothetical protein